MTAKQEAPKPEAMERLARVRLVVLDVDGVLTDGRVVYSQTGENQSFSVYDGQGIKLLHDEGLRMAWISGRGSAATERRARELAVDELVMQSGPKEQILAKVQERLGVPPEETASMGDDLPDLGLRARSAFFACPPNARPELRALADLVTKARGGEGAVREFCEQILRAKDRWQAIVASLGG